MHPRQFGIIKLLIRQLAFVYLLLYTHGQVYYEHFTELCLILTQKDYCIGRRNGSIFPFITDFGSPKMISKKGIALRAVTTDTVLVFINMAARSVENL